MAKDALGLGPLEEPRNGVTCEFWHTLQKCQHIVVHFSCSTRGTFLLQESRYWQECWNHLIGDVPIHWNSTSAMIEYLERQDGRICNDRKAGYLC